MQAEPAISVLIAVRDGGRFIDASLASLAGQTFRDFEIVLVDNGSRDGSALLLARWAEREPRLRLFRRERPGIAASLNFAAAQARAPLLAKLDADDLAHPRRLELQHRAMAARPGIGVLGSAAEVIDGAGRRLGFVRPPLGHYELRERLREACPLVHSSVMMRADLFRSAGGYREGLGVAEDYDLWTRLAETGELAAMPEILCSYRIHGDSLTSRRPARMALAGYCVAAAAEARRRGETEPFIQGVPALRRAHELRGASPREARKAVRLIARRTAISRGWLTAPVPALARAGLRSAALRLNLRPLYVGLLRALPMRRSRRARPLEEAS